MPLMNARSGPPSAPAKVRIRQQKCIYPNTARFYSLWSLINDVLHGALSWIISRWQKLIMQMLRIFMLIGSLLKLDFAFCSALKINSAAQSGLTKKEAPIRGCLKYHPMCCEHRAHTSTELRTATVKRCMSMLVVSTQESNSYFQTYQSLYRASLCYSSSAACDRSCWKRSLCSACWTSEAGTSWNYKCPWSRCCAQKISKWKLAFLNILVVQHVLQCLIW